MADEERLDVVVSLRDQASATADKVREAMKSLRTEAKTRPDTSQLKQLETVAYSVGRELGTTIRLLGVQGAFVSGGLVASVTAISGALGNFARSSLVVRSTAQELNLTVSQFERFRYAAQASGASSEQATAGITALGRSILDLRRGIDSTTRDKLRQGAYNQSGANFASELQDQLQREGVNKVIETVLQRISAESAKGTPEGAAAAQVIREAFGLGGPEFNRTGENLKEFGMNIIVPTEKAAQAFVLQMIKLQVSMNNLYNTIGIALLPAFTSLLDKLNAWLGEDAGKKFIETFRQMWESLSALDWNSIRSSVMSGLNAIGTEVVRFVHDVREIVKSLDNIVRMVDSWKQSNRFEAGKGQLVPYLNQSGGDTPQRFMSDPFNNTEANNPFNPPKYRFNPDPDFLSGSPMSTNIDDRRGETFDEETGKRYRDGVEVPESPFSGRQDRRRTRQNLNRQTEEMAVELQRLVDIFRDVRGSGDGGVSKKGNRTSPMQTRAGGAGGAGSVSGGGVLPGFSRSAIDFAADEAGGFHVPKSIYGLGSGMRPLQLGFGKYERFPGVGMIEDRRGEPALPKPSSYENLTSFFRADMENQKSFQAGQLPRPSIERYEDSSLAKALGGNSYTLNPLSSPVPRKRGDVFMGRESDREADREEKEKSIIEERGTDPIRNYRTPWSRHPRAGAAGFSSDRAAGFSSDRAAVDSAMRGFDGGGRSGSLNLDVNVKGPRGTKVDASVTEGDFVPADRGITVNREMPATSWEE